METRESVQTDHSPNEQDCDLQDAIREKTPCQSDAACGRLLCSRGTGEQVFVTSFSAANGKLEEFEFLVQECARCLYDLKSGITDVRVCHPRRGDVIFIITFLSVEDLVSFQEQQATCMKKRLAEVVKDAQPIFQDSGCLMPACHTLPSLLKYLEKNVKGTCCGDHDVSAVAREVGRWFPRRKEYEQYVHWDEDDPTKYTRNLIFSNEHMDVLLMCWPPNSMSSIHCHNESSCWVVLVEGEVHEVQYAMPVFDRQFFDSPDGSVGRCAKLKRLGETKLNLAEVTSAYASNSIGLHRVENRTNEPALTLHVYAPGLRKMKIFKECGTVCLMTLAAPPIMSSGGVKTGEWTSLTHPDGILDVDEWNCEAHRRISS